VHGKSRFSHATIDNPIISTHVLRAIRSPRGTVKTTLAVFVKTFSFSFGALPQNGVALEKRFWCGSPATLMAAKVLTEYPDLELKLVGTYIRRNRVILCKKKIQTKFFRQQTNNFPE